VGVQTSFDVDMADILFNPTELTIPANVDVTINLTNSGVLEHTFDVGDVSSGIIPAGGTGSVTLNLAPGTYDYICAIPGHKEAGMVGTLTVVDDSGGSTDASSTPIALDMVELAFKPDSFEIAANTDVTINLTNSGNLPHNFSIPSEEISVDLAAGESSTFVLNLPPGTYDFDCNVPGHKDAGMVGKLTVK
jgi:nitrite reductase (NO-forming)